ncbi:hypothetical protein G3O07_18440 [Pseudomonas laurentiana]|uniref:Phage tail fibre protein N-terminal domain-containing protein n=1 Tax=Pseudomonas laurentiana TaxID=2364649 RepID=A0A6I5RT98_9PSED|nr:hypothetical protein [Pseudomonas laurentiana]
MVNQNSIFGGMLTTAGAAKKTNCDALGVPWEPSHMLIGDANGADPVPNPGQTKLINQVYRAPLNHLYVSPTDPNVLVAELVLPPNVGGWWIRELALEDVDGVFSAVANCAPSYKPLLVQGSGRNQVVRMHIATSGTANIQLKIDPSVVLATREFVTEELAKQDFKHSVLAATTGPIVLSGLQTIDTVVLPAGAAVLVKDQVAAKDNGLYVVAAGAWARRADADTSAKVTPGLLVHVEKGAVNGDAGWQLVTDGPINLGVSALAFEMAFGRTGVAAGTYRSVTVDKCGRVVGATNPNTVEGYGLTDVYTMTQIDQALALKAPLASPDFSGIPKAPTAAPGTNTLQLASTAFVQAALAALVASSPAALDTLSELANALGNDPNFATTILNALALKAPLASPALTGTPTGPTAAPGTNTLQLATTAFVAALGALKANLASPALTGTPTAPTAAPGTNTLQLATTAFVQAAVAALVSSSPAALDTLNELAAALGNDPNFATTMTNILAGKAAIVDVVRNKTDGTVDVGVDWNTIVSAGRHPKLAPGDSPSGPGAAGSYFYPEVMYHAGQAFTQLAYPYATSFEGADSIYFRSRYNTTWHPWRALQHSGHYASKTEAEEGTASKRLMSPLAVSQAIASHAPPGFISGLSLAVNATTPNTDIDVEVGRARDSTDTVDLILAAGLTKRFQAAGAWSAGAGGNALFPGAKVANTFYHFFLIRKDSDGSVDVGFDTSLVAANRPAGYSKFVRLKGRAVKTDSAGNIIPFINIGNTTEWKALQRDMQLTNATPGSTTVAVSVPPGIRARARTYASIAGETAVIFVRSPESSAAVLAGPKGQPMRGVSA